MTESETTGAIQKRYACSTCGDEFDSDVGTCPFDGTKLTVIAQKLAPGTLLAGRFEVIDSLGAGGMGTVYKATHKLMKRNVALKTIQTGTMSGATLKRFQQEAQALSALNHPNILQVFDFFISDDGQPYLVMDYLEGTTLEEIRVKSGAMLWQRAVNIFTQACAGLQHAHEHGIIHRDVKPANIMLVNQDGKSDVVKIVDFGIAKLRDPGDTESHLTATGDTFGSPQYMSPEQCHAGPLDARSDIYSLGCVMYATITGSPPFPAGDSMECMYRQVNEPPPPFARDLGCPPALEAIIIKAMAKEPAARYQSARELGEELSALLSGTTAAAPAQPVIQASARGGSFDMRAAIAIAVIVPACLIAAWFGMNHPNADKPSGGVVPPPENNSAVSVPTPTPSSAVPETQPSPLQSSSAESEEPAGDLSRTQQSEKIYADNMEQGQQAFAAGNYHQAQEFFNAAHRASQDFGELDSRFLDSLEWQGKVAGALGDTVLEKQAQQYVSSVRERLRRNDIPVKVHPHAHRRRVN